MHEYSVARCLVEVALREALRHGAVKVLEVRISLGKLSLVNPDQLVFWLRTLSEGTVLEGCDIVVEEEEGEIYCPSCGYRGPISLMNDPLYHVSFPTLSCPECGRKAEVVRGRDCVLKSLRIVRGPIGGKAGA